MSIKISEKEKIAYNKFIRSHFKTHSQRAIARMLKLGKTTVNRFAKEEGLLFKKHTVNEEFFNTFSEEMAYILGFIFADGNVAYDTVKGYYTLTITSSEKDVIHLEKIRKILSSTKPLIYAPKTKSYKLIVNSKIICKKLIDLGVIPRKSLVVKFPDIPREYTRHFLRGVIDGDGTVQYVQRKRSPYFGIRIFSGSIDFCTAMRDIIKEYVNIDTIIRKANTNVYELQYTCTRGKRLAKYIYTDASIYLERKYKKYKENVKEE